MKSVEEPIVEERVKAPEAPEPERKVRGPAPASKDRAIRVDLGGPLAGHHIMVDLTPVGLWLGAAFQSQNADRMADAAAHIITGTDLAEEDEIRDWLFYLPKNEWQAVQQALMLAMTTVPKAK